MNTRFVICFCLVIFNLSCGKNDKINPREQDDQPCPFPASGDRIVDNKKLQHFENCTKQSAPCILSVNWGEIKVLAKDGSSALYKDAILSDLVSEEWNWRNDGTSHNPGVTIKAIQSFIHQPDITDIIISRGMEGVLQVPQKTIDAAKKAGKKVYIDFTRAAMKKFNQLKQDGKKVIGLFHSTC